ncbi:MAG: hypothetical protein ACOC6P_03220 [Candidatus Aminicenantaceae bacterium]
MGRNVKANIIAFILITIVVAVLSRHIMVLLHEWTHGATATAFGFKDSPFDIHYGGWALLTVDENVNYNHLFSTGHNIAASIISMSALITNALLFLLSIFLLSTKKIQKKRLVYLCIYWFAVMNIGELYSYIPLRTLAVNRGDVGHFTYGLSLSPWFVFIPGSLLVGWGLWHIFKKETPRLFQIMSLDNKVITYIQFALLVFVIFFWFGSSAFYDYGYNCIWSIWSMISIVIGFLIFFISIPLKKDKID